MDAYIDPEFAAKFTEKYPKYVCAPLWGLCGYIMWVVAVMALLVPGIGTVLHTSLQIHVGEISWSPFWLSASTETDTQSIRSTTTKYKPCWSSTLPDTNVSCASHVSAEKRQRRDRVSVQRVNLASISWSQRLKGLIIIIKTLWQRPSETSATPGNVNSARQHLKWTRGQSAGPKVSASIVMILVVLHSRPRSVLCRPADQLFAVYTTVGPRHSSITLTSADRPYGASRLKHG